MIPCSGTSPLYGTDSPHLSVTAGVFFSLASFPSKANQEWKGRTPDGAPSSPYFMSLKWIQMFRASNGLSVRFQGAIWGLVPPLPRLWETSWAVNDAMTYLHYLQGRSGNSLYFCHTRARGRRVGEGPRTNMVKITAATLQLSSHNLLWHLTASWSSLLDYQNPPG